MAQVTENTIHYILAYAAQGKHFPLTVNELQQLAYLAGRQLASPSKMGGDEREADIDAHMIERFATILAEISLTLKGVEQPLQRHSYHDLPKLVAELKLEVELHRANEARAALSADGGDRHREAELGPLVYEVCTTLPSGWQIRIDRENGYGGVTLTDPAGEERCFSGEDIETLSGQVREAIDAAIAASTAKGGCK